MHLSLVLQLKCANVECCDDSLPGLLLHSTLHINVSLLPGKDKKPVTCPEGSKCRALCLDMLSRAVSAHPDGKYKPSHFLA